MRGVSEHGLHGLFIGEHGILCYCVMRRGFEHGFHGLHGFFIGGVKTGGFGPIVRKHKIIREIRVIRVQ